MQPTAISLGARRRTARCFTSTTPMPRPALDPRVAYLMVNMLQEVLRSGTGAGVRVTRLQAARRRQDRHLARRLVRRIHQRIALRRLGGLRRQSRTRPGRRQFRAADLGGVHEACCAVPPLWIGAPLPRPSGVVSEQICTASGERAGPECPDVRWEVFIAGTETHRCMSAAWRSGRRSRQRRR